ncbi:hypothetical protein QL285_072806 [Trifolium repens]|nr:hypothetical protein QL285_072806 [Trifolium repens]
MQGQKKYHTKTQDLKTRTKREKEEINTLASLFSSGLHVISAWATQKNESYFFYHPQRLYLSGVSRHDRLHMTQLKQGEKQI